MGLPAWGIVALALVPLTIALPVVVYDEDFARHIMVKLAAASYVDDVQRCLDDQNVTAKVFSTYTVQCDTNDTCFGYTAVSEAHKAIIVAFRGSEGFYQIAQEAKKSVFGKRQRFYGMGTVGEYFYDAFIWLWNAGMHADYNLLHRNHPDYQIWVTGHSLGAAIATLAASAIVSQVEFPMPEVRLVTFGQPRVGDIYFALAHDYALPYSFRVTHARDIVTEVPPPDLRYYFHHRQEIYYPGNMTVGSPYRICQSDEDVHCSDGHSDISMKDHRHYFEINVPSYCHALFAKEPK